MEPASSLSSPGISFYTLTPPKGPQVAEELHVTSCTSPTAAEASQRYAGGVGGAAGSSSAASAPPLALHTLIVKRQRLAAFGAARDPETLNSWCAWAPRCSFPIPKARGARFTFFILSSPAGANRPGARGPRAAAPSCPSPFGSSRPRAPPSPLSPATRTRARPARALSLSSGPRDPLPFRLAALSRAAVFSIQPRHRGAPPRPPTAGPLLPNSPRFLRSPVGA